MLYITGIHALNLPCKLDTCGDWHKSAIQWAHPQMRDSDEMFFGNYGLEPGHVIPEHGDEKFVVANTIRALLDLLYEGNFPVAQGMNEDFICNDKYDTEVFTKVSEMESLPSWEEINRFMEKEYRLKWVRFRKEATDAE